MNDNMQIASFNMRRQFDRFETFRPQLDKLVEWYGGGKIKPHVDRTFRFDEAASAHHWLHDRKARGKRCSCLDDSVEPRILRSTA
jgi:synaptic vesicle membrane protein VAT-1